MTSLAGKTVFITGAGRGQGRAHAVAFARAGANVIAVDIDKQIDSVMYPVGSAADLQVTRELVEAEGSSCLASVADVRSQEQLDAVVAEGISSFGRIDSVIANAGIMGFTPFWELSESQWTDMIDVNLSGVWRTVKAVTPHMIDNRSGTVVITSSINGLEGAANYAHYISAKHGLIGLTRAIALELGPHNIRCNAVCPGVIDTPMNHWQGLYDVVNGGPGGTVEGFVEGVRHAAILAGRSAIPPERVSDAMLFLSSDQSSEITGMAIPVDAGKHLIPGYNHAPVL
jgi:SDR family mycofactocin-dependent oxidoreductase